MDELLALKNQGTLTAEQQQELDTYLALYERIVLQRAHAVVLLKQRDYDLSTPQILTNPSATPL